MYYLRFTAKTPIGKKVACMVSVSDDVVEWPEDGEPVIEAELIPYLAARSMEDMVRVAHTSVDLHSVAIAEQMEVTAPLTQEEFDENPEYAEEGTKVGDLVTDWMTIRSAQLDKKLFAITQDVV